MLDVKAYGMSYMDLLLQTDHLPKPNLGAHTLDASWQYGGKEATALVAVAKLGRTCGMIGPVGGMTGQLIRRDYERFGIDTSHLIDIPGGESPFNLVLSDQETNGRSFMKINPHGNLEAMEPEQLSRDFVVDCHYFLISGGDAPSAACAAWCKEAGVPVVMDADTHSDESDAVMHLVDHAIYSEFYYGRFFGKSEAYETNLRELRKRQDNPRAVTAVTLGEKGCVGIDDEGSFFSFPAHKITVADTTGAGDVFHGAYIVGRLEGYSAADACRFSSAVSAIKCTRLGGRAAIPTMPVVQKCMKTGEIDYGEIDGQVAYYGQTPFRL